MGFAPQECAQRRRLWLGVGMIIIHLYLHDVRARMFANAALFDRLTNNLYSS